MDQMVGIFSIVGVVFALIIALAQMSAKAGRLQTEVDELKTRVREDKDHNDKRFGELYESRNELQNNMGILNNTMLHVVEVMTEIKTDLKEFMEKVRECKDI
jgi:uncharacterized membrane protein (DUF106 family)